MKTIPAALTTAQKTVAGTPVATADLLYNDHPPFVQLFNNATYSGAPTVACPGTGGFMRLRKSGGGALQWQFVDAPGTQAEWTTWTELVAAGAISNFYAVFWTGTYFVAVWQDSSDKDLKYRRTDDNGATWSATAVAYALADNLTAIHGISGGATQGGIVHARPAGSPDIYFGRYDATANTWAAVVAAGLTATSITNLAAAYDTTNTRWLFAFTASGHLSYADGGLFFMQRTVAGGFTATRLFYGNASATSEIANLSLSQEEASLGWWLSFDRVRAWGSEKFWLSYSSDGIFWEESIALDVAAEAKFTVLGTLAGFVWMANERYVYRALVTPTVWSGQTVRSYQFDARLSDDGAVLRCDVDNRVAITEPTLFAKFRINRGLVVAGVTHTVPAGAFRVTGYEYVDRDNYLRITAVDALGLLQLFVADQTFLWQNERIDTLVRLVCALAGVHTITFDANAVWSDTIALFAIQGGGQVLDAPSALSSLRSLAARAGFEFFATQAGGISCYVPTVSPAAGYTYGSASAEHLHWPLVASARAVSNYSVVFGSDPLTISAESADYAAQLVQGKRLTDYTTEPRITAVADATDLAANRLNLAKESKRAAALEAPPSFSLEPGDVVAVNQGWAQTNGPWRVARVIEEYGGNDRKRFSQRLTLRAVP